MYTNQTVRNILRIFLGTAFVLLIPLLGMLFSDEWNWDLADFVIAGLLILIPALTYELIVKKFVSAKYQVFVGLALAAVAVLFFIEAAVGIF